MKTANLERPRPDCGRALLGARTLGASLLTALLLAAGNSSAQPSVVTLSGGPGAGYVDGNNQGSTPPNALFHTPLGMALGSDLIAGRILYVADRDNNAIRKLELDQNQTITFLTSRISQPVGVALDNGGTLYVLNRGNGANGNILSFNRYGNFLRTNALALTNATGFVIDGSTNMYVVGGNSIVKITIAGIKTTLTTIGAANTSLRGITLTSSGSLAVTDAGNHGIYVVNPSSGAYSALTGFMGAGDTFGAPGYAQFNQPYGISAAGGGWLVVADYGNHRVKTVDPDGNVCSLYGVCSNNWVSGTGLFPGWFDGNGCPCEITCQICNNYAEARYPASVMVAADGSVYTTEIFYHVIRQVSGTGLQPPPPFPPVPPTIVSIVATYGQVTLAWTPVTGATSYNVKRSNNSGGPYGNIANVATTNYTDTTVFNGSTYYYVVSALNPGGESANSAEASVTVPLPPVPTPQIGWVSFPPPGFTSVFHAGSSFVFNNDVPIIIVGTSGSQTYYTYGPTPATGDIPDPTSASASALAGYTDGLFGVSDFDVAHILPDVIYKAIGEKNDGSPNSGIARTRFQFVAANPVVIGNNAASFVVSDLTTNAVMWYTVDGTDPTNAAPSLGPVQDGAQLSFNGSGTFTFKVRAFRGNYQPSGIVSAVFSPTNFAPNQISFGFASGEASSAFVAAPGQLFYAPITLSNLPLTRMYSLQFNVTVTNLDSAPPITPGAFGFQSMLTKPIVGTTLYYVHGTTVITANPTSVVNGNIVQNDPIAGTTLYTPIPPWMFAQYQSNPPPPSAIVYDSFGKPFVDLMFTNSSINLLGVGWVERFTFANLYNTVAQDLVTYSQAHDDIFPNPANPGKIIVGGYSFLVPGSATNGQQYRIAIGRPSATSDGVGAPGSDVFIATPTNGAVHAITNVTVGVRKYIAGDVYPFGWFNAGDFGKGYLVSADVLQVFESAIYNLNNPLAGSDFFDAMDSCGNFGTNDGTGTFLQSTFYTNGYLQGGLAGLFDGGDTNINQIAFGDGQLDVCDVYVTFRRSLDPSLLWYERYWQNGVRVADTNVANNFRGQIGSPGQLGASYSYIANTPSVSFSSDDVLSGPGQTFQVPIRASVFGSYPLRVLMLNLTVAPLDGSPPLMTPVQFTPNVALGEPTTSESRSYGNYAAAWLNSQVTGLTSNAVLGWLTVTIPTNATGTSAYAVHFEHASASPNGIASFAKQTRTGLITFSSRSTSSYNDGIPDSWRLRYFGTVNNLLSQASADADGDGMNNWQEYVAGTDPTDPKSVLRVTSTRGTLQGSVSAIHWPSVANTQYVIERSATLFPANWSAISTNTGTGGNMEFDDSTGGGSRFYRVRVGQ